MKTYIIGMDIGGTNTDAILMDCNENILAATKTNTTDDIVSGFLIALQNLLKKSGIAASDIRSIFLGSTHATNAILQNKDLYRVGVIRIAGHNPETLPPCFAWPQELKAGILAGYATINGGYECHGTPITPLDRQQARMTVEQLLEKGAESIALVGVFSPLNGDQEKEVAQIVREVAGTDYPVSLSHEVGGMGFIERENTTLLNAALKKVMEQGFRQIEFARQQLGLECPLFITQNNGSIITLQQAIAYPVLTISAGPTNSFIGGARMAGLRDAIVVDIGGTSTDVGLVRNGFPRRSLNTSNIGGVRLNFSMPDVLSIALGGGSYVSLEGEQPKIGPLSAGRNIVQQAFCFGGSKLTFTDMSMALGHLEIPGACRSRISVSSTAAQQVIEEALRRIQKEVSLMEGDQKQLPILLVGGGAALLPKQLLGSRYQIPAHASVANAYGAALAEISGVIDTVVSLNERERVLGRLQELARDAAIRQGADAHSVQVVDVQITPYHYVPNNMARVTILAAGKQALAK